MGNTQSDRVKRQQWRTQAIMDIYNDPKKVCRKYQDEVTLRGHNVETRINFNDALHDIPQTLTFYICDACGQMIKTHFVRPLLHETIVNMQPSAPALDT